MLVGVAGRGWYVEEGKPAQPILPGTVIHIPANVKHWHGAASDSWFAHLAFEIPGENTSNEWLEPVTDDEYNLLKEIAITNAYITTRRFKANASSTGGVRPKAFLQIRQLRQFQQ